MGMLFGISVISLCFLKLKTDFSEPDKPEPKLVCIQRKILLETLPIKGCIISKLTL